MLPIGIGIVVVAAFLLYFLRVRLWGEKKSKEPEITVMATVVSKEQLGARPSGVSIVAYQDDKIMLLKEFRMSINKSIYNLCAGMLEKGETLELYAYEIEFGGLKEGSKGQLTYQGRYFVRFEEM